MVINHNSPIKEGFTQRRKYVLKRNDDIFDDFYVPVYDQLMKNKVKNLFEVKEIARTTKYNKHSVLLDIGSGLGHHVNLFNRMGGEKCVGLDKSPAMVRASQYKYNDSEFKTGDVMDFMNFDAQSFTHITCLYFTIYYIKDKRRFFNYDKNAAANLDWFYHLTGGHTHTDFFAIRPTDYSKANEKEDFEDIW